MLDNDGDPSERRMHAILENCNNSAVIAETVAIRAIDDAVHAAWWVCGFLGRNPREGKTVHPSSHGAR
jgi:hypothetical protein